MRGPIRSAAAVTGAALAALGLAVGLMSALPASATTITGSASDGTYLALGDSVAFGFVPDNASPPPNYLDAHSFVGYPEDVAQALHIRVWNASCPGETTESMLVAGVQSNGCENSPGSSIGYRTQFPLHVQYQGTQMEYALKYLADHRHTQLVTINIGANDAFLCEELQPHHCTTQAELLAVLLEIKTNLERIYTQIRDVAHYQGLIVALTYYSLSYSDPVQVQGAEALDSVIKQVTEAFKGKVASGFDAFEGPSSHFGGDPCAAGLLIEISPGNCNIHPSPEGHLLLAQAIEDVVGTLPPK